MGLKYIFTNQDAPHFVTFTVIDWIDVFTRNEYKQLIIDSLDYCRKNKGLIIYAWVIMTNHIHLIIAREEQPSFSDIIRDFKTFTSSRIRSLIEKSDKESRKTWMMNRMKWRGSVNSRNIDFQFWEQDNHPIILDSSEKALQRLNYLHNNPVKAGFVSDPKHWLWSSAIDYANGKGMLEIRLLDF